MVDVPAQLQDCDLAQKSGISHQTTEPVETESFNFATKPDSRANIEIVSLEMTRQRFPDEESEAVSKALWEQARGCLADPSTPLNTHTRRQ